MYVRHKRVNDKFGKGIHPVFGFFKRGGSRVQSIRFDASRFTVTQAKKWLRGHDFKSIKFEPATRRNIMPKAIPTVPVKKFSWQSPDGKQRGTFRANPDSKPVFAYKAGERRFSTARANPAAWADKGPTYTATLFVGFSVGDKPTWTMDYLIRLVKRVRIKQVKHPDSSFLYQKGIYTHESNGKVVTEDGAQAIILNVPPMVRKHVVFRRHMIKLAETICRDMKQETVILRIDKNGVLDETIGVIE
jgi:hypothetical protein